MGKYTVSGNPNLPFNNATYGGVAFEGSIRVVDQALPLGLIATGQTIGYKFGTDGTITAVVTCADPTTSVREQYAQGRDIASGLQAYETEHDAHALSELLGIMNTSEAQLALNVIYREVLGNTELPQPIRIQTPRLQRAVLGLVGSSRH